MLSDSIMTACDYDAADALNTGFVNNMLHISHIAHPYRVLSVI